MDSGEKTKDRRAGLRWRHYILGARPARDSAPGRADIIFFREECEFRRKLNSLFDKSGHKTQHLAVTVPSYRKIWWLGETGGKAKSPALFDTFEQHGDSGKRI